MRVLVVNEPLAYREAVSRAIREMRPRARIRESDPAELYAQLKSFQPRMVICSQLPEVLPAGPEGWVELYPGGSGSSTLVLGKERVDVPSVQLADLLSVLDKLASRDTEAEKPLQPD